MKIRDFQKLIPNIQLAIELEVQKAVASIAEKIAATARNKLGTSQEGWEELADSTIKEKSRKGEPTPSPLLATGKLRDSIQVDVDGKHAVIGTNDEAGLYQETGTSHIPPRPWLVPSAIEHHEDIEKAIEQAVIKAFSPGRTEL